jgi:hypothetical protein
MPYFNDANEENILLIHIPKTGGSSLEHYFSKISNGKQFLSSESSNTYYNKSLQHLELNTIITNKEKIKEDYDIDIDLDDPKLKIITVVRNPYTRIISELFWNNSINKLTSKSDVYKIILNIFRKYNSNNNILDNHIKPQFKYLIDENGNFYKNITILRKEKLTEMMQNIGYNSFNEYINIAMGDINPFNYLNKQSIRLINNFYFNDFICFGYKIIKI